MRIAQVRQKFPIDGGAEAHVYQLSKGLAERGHDVTVFTSDRDLHWRPSYERRCEAMDGIRVLRFKPVARIFRNLLIPSLLTGLLKEKLGIIHAHGHFYNSTELAALAGKLRKIPLILTPHYQPYFSYKDRLERYARLLYRAVALAIFKAASRIICVSPWTKSFIEGCYKIDEEKIEVIPNGIDLQRFAHLPDGSAFREKYKVAGPIALFVGHISKRKGLESLVHATPLVRKPIPDVTFLIVGPDRGCKAHLQSLAQRLGLGENFMFTGYLPDDELLQAYASADLLVLPSLYEAFGMVLLEAMASGLPVVATKCGGVPYVVKDGREGILVEPMGHLEMAEAITKLLTDQSLARAMGAKGREKAQGFGWSHVVDKTLRVYERALAEWA